jgi:hypothetical protein
MNVRNCADTACEQIAILNWEECLNFDARLIDNSWLRISEEQDVPATRTLAGKWVSSGDFSLVFGEFQSYIEAHDLAPFFERLPVVTPPPTPGG